MKNKIAIDIDTERDVKIIIGKASDTIKPTNREEATTMINFDIICLTEALCDVIDMATSNGCGPKNEYITYAIEKLNSL